MISKGEAMKKARISAGLSARELARITGVSHSSIVLLEADKREGMLSTIELLADTLGLSIDEYIGHTVVERSNNICTEEKSTSQISE